MRLRDLVREVEFRNKIDKLSRGERAVRSVFDEKTSMDLRSYAPTDPRILFENNDIDARVLQAIGDAKTRYTPTDNTYACSHEFAAEDAALGVKAPTLSSTSCASAAIKRGESFSPVVTSNRSTPAVLAMWSNSIPTSYSVSR